jgi:nucleotide-binding universal stress UspA family protein
MDILLAYDGSDPADHALRVAVEQFDPDRVTALYVFAPGEAGYDTRLPFGTDRELEELASERASELLSEIEQLLPERVTVRTVHEIGDPAREIVSYAETHEVDHIVLGSHGREGVSRLLLGSVAEKVVRRSPAPVTVVR